MNPDHARRPRLLVVDDEADNREFFAETGDLAGYAVASLGDVRELESALQPAPDVILLDLIMPHLDGIEVIRELARAGCRSRLILVSGCERRVLQAALRLAQGFGLDVLGELQKPVSVAALTALLLQPGMPPARVQPLQPVTLDELHAALAENRFTVHYQPQVALHDGRWCGVEGLVRWCHPQHGLLLPDSFVPLVERGGLGLELTRCVLECALADLAHLHGLLPGGRLPGLSVNLPGEALFDVSLPEQLLALVDAAAWQHDAITFEITETSLAREPVRALDILTRLRLKGVQLSIDDFGTGYSSFGQLHHLPFSELKIDLGFVRVADRDPVARAIVENSIRLGRQLGLTVVAEGVESATLWHWLREQGCDLAQGYLISRPMPAAQLSAWYAAWGVPACPA